MKHCKLITATLALLALTFSTASTVSATTLTTNQLQTVCVAVKLDPVANAARLAGDTITLGTWLNATRSPLSLAWRVDMSPQEIDEAANYTTYDSLSAGKRDEWGIFIKFGRSFAKNKNRNVVTDVWGTAITASVSESILQAGTYSATNAQAALGGTLKTTGTVVALDLNYTGRTDSGDATWLVQPANCN